MTNKKENDIVELTEDQIDNVSGGDLKMGDKTITYCEQQEEEQRHTAL